MPVLRPRSLLLEAIAAAPRKPADAVANDFFRNRRFIGGGDRRDVSDQVWAVLRHQRRLTWWIERAQGEPSPRLPVAALAVLGGRPSYGVCAAMYSGGRYAPEPLDAEEAEIAAPPQRPYLRAPGDAGRRAAGSAGLDHAAAGRAASVRDTEREVAAMLAPAPLDLRVNLLKGDREAAIGAPWRPKGSRPSPTALSPWGLRIEGRRPW